MKRLLIISIILLISVAFAVSGFSQPAAEKPAKKEEVKKTEPAVPAKPAAPAKKEVKKPKARQLTGEVAAIDAAKKTVAVKRMVKKEAKEFTFNTDEKTSILKNKKKLELADIKTGDRIRVRYTEEEGKRLATSITIFAPKEKKVEKKVEEKKPEKPAEKK